MKAYYKQGIMLYGLPPQAEVFIDNKRIGIGAELNYRSIELSTGKHRLVILSYKHYPYHSFFSLESNILLKRKPFLRKKLVE